MSSADPELKVKKEGACGTEVSSVAQYPGLGEYGPKAESQVDPCWPWNPGVEGDEADAGLPK